MNRYHCPDHVNPAEFLADLISIDYSSADSVYSSQKRIDGLVESFSQQTSAVLYATPLTRRESFKSTRKFSEKAVVKKKGVWWRQFWLLLRRAWMQVILFYCCAIFPYFCNLGKELCISYVQIELMTLYDCQESIYYYDDDVFTHFCCVLNVGSSQQYYLAFSMFQMN